MATDATTHGRRDVSPPAPPDRRAPDHRSVARGLVGGLVATVVMTLFRAPISRSPPPTARFWAKYVAGGEPDDHVLVGLVLHLAYGAGGGGLFAALAPIPRADSELRQELLGVVAGLVYGLLLSAFGERVVLRGLLDVDPRADERFVFHLGHAVYGLTLGTWVGSREE